MTTRELLQTALDALWDCMNSHGDADWSNVDATMNKIRAHLAKPAPKNIVGTLHVRDLGIVSSSIRQPIPDGDYYVVSQDHI